MKTSTHVAASLRRGVGEHVDTATWLQRGIRIAFQSIRSTRSPKLKSFLAANGERCPSSLITFRLLTLALLAGLLGAGVKAQPSPAALAAPAPKMEFDQFVLVLLLRPPNAPELPKPELDGLQEGHIANIRRLHAEGKLLKAGPTDDESARNVRGIFILTTASVAQAREWVASDPPIKRGRLVAEYLKWYVEKGSLK